MKILFVSTDQHDLGIVKQIFTRGNHQLTAMSDAEAALKLASSNHYDVIIASQLQPAMSGSELLAELKNANPSAIRILIVTDNTECKFAHQHFSSPLQSAQVIEVIESFARSNGAITKKQIVDAVASIKTLPSPPKVYMRLNSMLKDPRTDSQKIAEVIVQDPALVAKVLHVVNSSAMSKGKQIKSIPEAITKMGVDTLCCIVMTAELFSYDPNIEGFNLSEEQLHSLNVAKLAASIVKPEFKLDTLLAGLLHGLGKLVLFEIDPKLTKQFFNLATKSMDNIALERKIFGTDHCQIGGYLLHQWSFPYPVIEAVVLHLSPEKLCRKSFAIAQAVYMANKLIREQEVDDKFIEHFKLASVLEKLEQRAEKLRASSN